MRNVLLIGFLLSLVAHVHGQDNRLEGVWVIDENSTLAFNLKNLPSSSVAVGLTKCTAKASSLAFSAGVMKYSMASHRCEANGKSSQIEGYETRATYRVLASSSASVAIATTAADGEESFDVLHFNSNDKFWIYSPGSPPEYEDHMRIFYIRKQ